MHLLLKTAILISCHSQTAKAEYAQLAIAERNILQAPALTVDIFSTHGSI